MDENSLLNNLVEWFQINSNNFQKRNFLSGNKVARQLKSELQKVKHWKNRPRGSAKKLSKSGNQNNLRQNNKSEIKPAQPKAVLSEREQILAKIKQLKENTVMDYCEKSRLILKLEGELKLLDLDF